MAIHDWFESFADEMMNLKYPQTSNLLVTYGKLAKMFGFNNIPQIDQYFKVFHEALAETFYEFLKKSDLKSKGVMAKFLLTKKPFDYENLKRLISSGGITKEMALINIEDVRKDWKVMGRTDKLFKAGGVYRQELSAKIDASTGTPSISNIMHKNFVDALDTAFNRVEQELGVIDATSGDLSQPDGDGVPCVGTLHKILTWAKERSKKLYYYVWWAIPEGQYEELANSMRYPMYRGTYTPRMEESGSKYVEESLLGLKTDSHIKGIYLGDWGLTLKEKPFTSKDNYLGIVRKPRKIPLQDDDGNRLVICLGAARAKLWDFRLGERRSFTEKGLMDFDVQKLEWHWTKWVPGEGGSTPKQSYVKGKVVDVSKLTGTDKLADLKQDLDKALEGGTNIPRNLAERLYDADDIGVDDVYVNMHLEPPSGKEIDEGREFKGTQGKFEFDKVPIDTEITLQAPDHPKHDSYGGTGDQHVYPESKPFKFEGSYMEEEHAIILLNTKEGSVMPKVKIMPAQKNAKNHKQLKGPFGTKDVVTKLSEKDEGDQLCFSLTGDVKSSSFEGYYLRVFFAKPKDSDGKIWRPLQPAGELNGCHDVRIMYDHGKAQDGRIREAIQLLQKKPRTITPLFNAPPNQGTYRIYCLLTKGKVNYIKLLNDDVDYPKDRNLVDYNYIEFEVTPRTRKALKELGQLKKYLIDLRQKLDKVEKEEGKSSLRWNQTERTEILEKIEEILKRVYIDEEEYGWENAKLKKLADQAKIDSKLLYTRIEELFKAYKFHGVEHEKLIKDLEDKGFTVGWIKEIIKSLIRIIEIEEQNAVMAS